MRWSIALLTVSLLILSQGSLSACPMCSEAVSKASGADETDQFREAEAYNLSIYLMVSIPYLSLGVVGFLVYRGLHQNARQQAMNPSGGLSCPPPSIVDISSPAPQVP